MNTRERFLATMAFQPVDRIPLWDFGYWDQTLPAWKSQGAPLQDPIPAPKSPEEAAFSPQGFSYPWSLALLPGEVSLEPGSQTHLPLDPGILRVPLNSFISPPFAYRVVEERGDIILVQDPRGHIRMDKKDGASISNIVRPLVSNREDWERVKAERLALSLDGRLPPNWPQLRDALKGRDRPLAIGGTSAMFGFYHTTRYLLGPEQLLYSVYDSPDLVRDIMGHLADLYVFLFDKILTEISVDLAFATEDIGFKSGPFISPAMFREFVLPCYRKVMAMLREHGVTILIVDSDGNNWALIPLFLEGGVTGMAPMEVAADMDVVKIRDAFPQLQIVGGIDKRCLAAGREQIDQELEYKLGILGQGGYIPTVDHTVPPDVPWEHYVYYRQRVEALATTR
jgi:uroporphyrinogen decarboxylase